MSSERYFQIVKGAEPTLAEHLEGWHWCGLKIFFFTCCKGKFCQTCRFNPQLSGPF